MQSILLKGSSQQRLYVKRIVQQSQPDSGKFIFATHRKKTCLYKMLLNENNLSFSFKYVVFTLAFLLFFLIQESNAARFVGSMHLGRLPGKIIINGSYAYVLTDTSLIAVNISDPVHPYPVGCYYPPGQVTAIARSGNYAYLAINNKGLIAIDLQNPSKIAASALCSIPGVSKCIAISGSYALLLDTNGFYVIDIARFPNPEKKAYIRTRDSTDGYQTYISVSDTFAYVIGSKGLRVIVIHDPAHPREVGFSNYSHEAIRFFRGFAVSKKYAFAAEETGFQIFDISKPYAPLNCGFFSPAKNLFGRNAFVNSSNFLYTLNEFGMKIYSAALPTGLKAENGELYINDYSHEQPECMAIGERYAIIGDNQGDLIIVDISPCTVEPASDSAVAPKSAMSTDSVQTSKDFRWDSIAINGLRELPKNASRKALLDLIKPDGLQPDENLIAVYASPYLLKQNSFIIEMRILKKNPVGNPILRDWIDIVSIDKSSGAIAEIARPVNGYIEFLWHSDNYGFVAEPVRVGINDYAIEFKAHFYSPHFSGSEYIDTRTLFLPRHNILIPIVNMENCFSILRRIHTENIGASQDDTEDYIEDRYENYNSGKSMTFSSELSNGFYNLKVSSTQIDDAIPDSVKNTDLTYKWNGSRYVTNAKEDLLQDACLWIDCSIGTFVKGRIAEIKKNLANGLIVNAIEAEFDNLPSHSISLAADDQARQSIAEYRGAVLEFAHQTALKIYKTDPIGALRILGYGYSQYVRSTPKTDSSDLKMTLPFFDNLQDKIDSTTVSIINDYAYILSNIAADSKEKDNYFDKAAILLEKVIAADPARKPAYLNLGDILWELGRQSNAKACYKKYVHLMGQENKMIPKRAFERMKH
jgi:hypothetical protein